ncbi:hypothetical protein [Pedobacter sp. KBS0701]|uniref:hypothetical protein n=1 Tax=unclassified Pedobacter TaxID=2628915 RepID=UPI00110E6469|nr:hypothetical protein [Pedobacter sp. KBS0701]QDW24170.1 hypothetical protein FFJ24_004760 [Pedobacter sp. KBS0701]
MLPYLSRFLYAQSSTPTALSCPKGGRGVLWISLSKVESLTGMDNVLQMRSAVPATHFQGNS